MDAAACAAVSGTVFSAGVRTGDSRAVGIPVLLLVPVHVGDSDRSAAGCCLLPTEKLKTENRRLDPEGDWQGVAGAALPS